MALRGIDVSTNNGIIDWRKASKAVDFTIIKATQGRGAASIGEGVKKREPYFPVGRNVNCAATMEDRMEIPQKVKNRAPL